MRPDRPIFSGQGLHDARSLKCPADCSRGFVRYHLPGTFDNAHPEVKLSGAKLPKNAQTAVWP